MADRYGVYYKYYCSQYGGEIPIFRGGQHGAGLGDILRSVFRFIAPIAFRGIATFASNAIHAHGQGASFKDAARGALKPSLGAMMSTAAERLAPQQTGGSSALFSGVHGIPDMLPVEYKRGMKRKIKHKK